MANEHTIFFLDQKERELLNEIEGIEIDRERWQKAADERAGRIVKKQQELADIRSAKARLGRQP